MKAQVKMTETFAILLIFFILLLFGIIFYVKIDNANMSSKRAEAAGERAVSLSLRAMFMPELRCSKGENLAVSDCIDLYKLEATTSKMQENKEYYFRLFRHSKVAVKEIYPGSREHIIYDMPLEKGTSSAFTPVPLSLFDPVLKKYHLGVLNIEVYS